ncbi:unnamed protein product (macronuclear) [Paramecium tetraurelia]|uniref:DUSP domain-containing protein n=1 Tax=Paramecium tetraurelia TaxID=5888 RepID=A0BST4_PARTE|nr:uncharacterized protein GSPATT00031833001 [Paramecium tetraurelia]CAK61601.1 unnamed protein product [Paramecium tetraurelia]|eukprot:XP_001428999.1 hypothetical protein (macronuclear) [Paramecium tetraurelia strain d4-2]
MSLLEKFLEIQNNLSSSQLFAVNLKGFEQFSEELFCRDSNFTQIDNYSLCICQEESIQLKGLIANFKIEFNIDPQIIQLNSQEQVLKVDKRYQVHFVCLELWNFLMKHVKGGPCIPLYTIEINEIRKSTIHDFTFLSQHDIQDLPKGLVIPVDMTQMEFLIQNENDSFTYITKVVPLAFTIEQVINKILSPQFNVTNHLCFNQTSRKVILNKTSTLIYELEFRSLWFIKPNQKDNGFSENFDEITMQQDFQNHIPGSTESTFESREIQSILDSSKSNEFEDDINPNNNSNLMLRDISEFKNEIESILQNHKQQPLILLKEEQAIENINQIILQIEQENCFKKEQQEEGTNDELIDYQDI